MSFVKSIGRGIESAANFVVNPTNITRVFTDPVGLAEDAFDGLEKFGSDISGAIERDAERIADAVEEAAEEFTEAMDDLGDELDDAFSKDGVFTRFVEDNLPGGGFFTAIAHSAAGNEEHAQIAALKGVSTTLQAAAVVGGAAMGGPLGGAMGGALGGLTKNLFEGAMHELVPETMQHRFKELDPMDLIQDVAIGAALGGVMGGSNAGVNVLGRQLGQGATKSATDKVLKAAIKEGVEELSGVALKQAVSRQMMKSALISQMTKSAVIKGVSKEVKDAMADDEVVDEIPTYTKLEALELITRQAFENRVAAEAANPGADGELTATWKDPDAGPNAFAEGYDENLGTYYVRNGMVVWTKEEAELFEQQSDVVDRGYDSVAEYRNDIVNSFALAHDFDMEDGSNDWGGDWEMRSNDILGDFMVKNGRVVFGATTVEEAEQLVRGEFEREAQESSEYSGGDRYAVPTDEWVHGTNDLLGDYMIRDGKVVWGATTPEEAQEEYITDELESIGLGPYDEFKSEFERSYRISHELDLEAGRNLPFEEWTQRTHRVLGDYSIRNGEIVWGKVTPQEAEATYLEAHPELAPVDEEPSADDDPYRTDPSEIDWSTMTRAEVEALWAAEDAAEAERLAEENEPEPDLSTMTRAEIEAYWAEQDAEPDDDDDDSSDDDSSDDDGIGDTPVYEDEGDDDEELDHLEPDGDGMIDTDGDGIGDTPVYVVEADDDDFDWDRPLRDESVDTETFRPAVMPEEPVDVETFRPAVMPEEPVDPLTDPLADPLTDPLADPLTDPLADPLATPDPLGMPTDESFDFDTEHADTGGPLIVDEADDGPIEFQSFAESEDDWPEPEPEPEPILEPEPIFEQPPEHDFGAPDDQQNR